MILPSIEGTASGLKELLPQDSLQAVLLHLEPIEGLLPYPQGSLLLNLSLFCKLGPNPMDRLGLGVI